MATRLEILQVSWLPAAGLAALLLLSTYVLLEGSSARGCPFCTATSQTLSEEMAAAEAAVLATLKKPAPPPDPRPDGLGEFGQADPDTGMATFQIVDVLRGKERLPGVQEIEVVHFGTSEAGKTFLITGLGTERIDWSTPLPLSPEGEAYVRALDSLPEKGPGRLAFFQDYLESEDVLLRQDSYDEFARAPYAELIAMRDVMRHDELVEWILDINVPPSRRRLYLTMLGVCGSEADVPMLEFLIRPLADAHQMQADVVATVGHPLPPDMLRIAVQTTGERYDRLKRQGLDALIACYLKLRGPDGMPLIEDLFLRDPNTEFKDVFSAIMALRFHGEESNTIPRQRLLEGIRLILDNPTFADQVIPDLARWEDWSVLDRLVQMFKDADETSYVRQPIVTYVTVASEQEGDIGRRATEALKVLEKVDPETVERAQSLMAFSTLARADPKPPPSDAAVSPADAAGTASGNVAASGTADAAGDDVAASAVADVPVPKERVNQPTDDTTDDSTGDEPTDTAKITGTADADAEADRTDDSDAAHDDANEPLAGELAELPTEGLADERTPPPPGWITATVIGSAILLMACFWLILRGPSARA